MEELAADVSGASTTLVEHVLEEYGDPAEPLADGESDDELDDVTDDRYDPETDHPDVTMSKPDVRSTADPVSDLTRLSEKQRATLRAIYEHPDATQRDLAEMLDVSRTTVNQRVNSIDGFEWDSRRTFVGRIFDNGATTTESDDRAESAEPTESDESVGSDEPDESDGSPDSVTAGTTRGDGPTDSTDAEALDASPLAEELSEQVEELSQRVAALEDRLAELSAPPRSAFADPALVHKVVHACMTSEHVSEDEELRIIEEVLAPRGASD